jgi:hypothetical protein
MVVIFFLVCVCVCVCVCVYKVVYMKRALLLSEQWGLSTLQAGEALYYCLL